MLRMLEALEIKRMSQSLQFVSFALIVFVHAENVPVVSEMVSARIVRRVEN